MQQRLTEIRSLTGLRGVAALYVLLFHYFPPSTAASPGHPLTNVLHHGYLAVDLFFILSGFVMAMNYSHMFASGWSKAAYRRFLGRRIARIYPLYLATVIAGFLLVIAGWLRYLHAAPLGVALCLNLTMTQVWGLVPSFDSPAWSISAEWAAYLLFPALLVPTMFRRASIGWLSALISAATLAALSVQQASLGHDFNLREPLNLSDPWCALPVVRCVAEFTLGILAFRLAATPFGRHLASSRWLAPAVCVAALMLLAIPQSDLAVALLFPFLVISLASEAHVPGRLLAWAPAEFIGKLSFSIYLTHKLFYGLLNAIYLRAHAAGLPHAQSLAAIICISLTFPLAFAAYRTIEVPGRRWMRALFESTAAASAIHSHPLRKPETAPANALSATILD